jgi:patatin-like phospholipase/acyl hydrolase
MDKSFWDRRLPIQSEPKYDGTGKTEVLTEFFADKRIRDVEKPVLVTAYDLVTRRVVVFKSQGGSDAAYNPTLREVGNATSAAPTYFPTIESSEEPARWLVDGGLAANNPSMCALAEALRDGTRLEDVRVLSIGTGVPIRGSESPDSLGRKSQTWGGMGWLEHGLIDHLFAGNSTTCEYQCDVLLGVNHVRVNGPLTHASDDLDDVSTANIKNLREMGAQWYEQNEPAIRVLMRSGNHD